MALDDLDGIANVQFGQVSTETLTWETASDWDAAADQSGVAHESNGEYVGDSRVQLGYSTEWIDTTDIQAFYLMDEDSGSTATDYSGQANDGTHFSVVYGESGIHGRGAISYEGNNDDRTEFPTFVSSGSFSFFLVFKPDGANQGRITSPRAQRNLMLNQGFNVPNSNLGIYDGDAHDTGKVIDGNVWYTALVVVDDPNSDLYVYADGTEVFTQNSSIGSNDGDANTIGQGPNPPGDDPWSGNVAAWAFWNRVVSPTEMTELDDALTSGYLETATKSYSTARTPDLQNLDYSLNGESITLEAIGSPGTASEETVLQALDGATSYSLSWSDSHTDFRIRPELSTSTPATTPTFNRGELVG